ncbi:hypothetical protein L3X38_016503 [Prunus dulcis]|uniref:Uncharacterized protein n=1 Tax=Prunus dulcis TaxID=3755 RepID=A0AAD4W735_PRUDU|nr:hypothetical protein L3X38_016503 [Prunus dulcis]
MKPSQDAPFSTSVVVATQSHPFPVETLSSLGALTSAPSTALCLCAHSAIHRCSALLSSAQLHQNFLTGSLSTGFAVRIAYQCSQKVN